MKFTSIFFAASAAIFLTCHKKVRIFSEINTLHGAIFLFQTTDYPDYPDVFLSTDHIKNSWSSV